MGAHHEGITRSLAALGDSGNVNTWSNIPYFLFQAASRAGFLTHTLNLIEPHYKRHQLTWNLLTALRLRRPGGYQASRAAVERMWACVPPELRGGEFLSHFQLFPPPDLAARAGARHSFFVDATILQMHVADHPEHRDISKKTFADIIKREGETYRAARFFVGMARDAIDSAIRDYGVDPAKAFVVRPGANLDETVVRAYLQRRGAPWRSEGRPFTAERPARLGFIGRTYQRKGLPRLVEACEILNQRGFPTRVTVIGHLPEQYQRHPQIESLGFISKDKNMAGFVEAVDTFALGCLPSYYEPLGISTLEALRLGVPVMGTMTGGIPDCISPEFGFLLPVDVTGEGIADAIQKNVFDPATYHRLQQGAVGEMLNVTWDRTVEQLVEIWKSGK